MLAHELYNVSTIKQIVVAVEEIDMLLFNTTKSICYKTHQIVRQFYDSYG